MNHYKVYYKLSLPAPDHYAPDLLKSASSAIVSELDVKEAKMAFATKFKGKPVPFRDESFFIQRAFARRYGVKSKYILANESEPIPLS